MLLAALGSVRIGKNCDLGQHFQDLGHSFSLYGPPSRPITYIYFSKASHLASHILHTQIMNALLDNQTRFTFHDEAQQTPLHLAAYCGRYEQVDVLARRVASGLNERDEQGRTPLHNAVMNGHR